MGYIGVKCPHCACVNEIYYDIDPGEGECNRFTGRECESCGKSYGCEIRSENIYVESVWVEDEDNEENEGEES